MQNKRRREFKTQTRRYDTKRQKCVYANHDVSNSKTYNKTGRQKDKEYSRFAQNLRARKLMPLLLLLLRCALVYKNCGGVFCPLLTIFQIKICQNYAIQTFSSHKLYLFVVICTWHALETVTHIYTHLHSLALNQLHTMAKRKKNMKVLEIEMRKCRQTETANGRKVCDNSTLNICLSNLCIYQQLGIYLQSF